MDTVTNQWDWKDTHTWVCVGVRTRGSLVKFSAESLEKGCGWYNGETERV